MKQPDSSPLTPSSSSHRLRRFTLGCGLPLLILALTIGAIRFQARRVLTRRTEKIETDWHSLKPTLRHQRRYPFSPSLSLEASRFYRALEWNSNPSLRPSDLSATEIQRLETGLWEVASKDLREFGTILDNHRIDPRTDDQWPPGRLQAALDFAARHGPVILDFIRQALRCDHLEWPTDLRQGFDCAAPDFSLHHSLAQSLHFTSSKQPPSQALETALALEFYGHDMALHPTINGLLASLGITRIAQNRLETLIANGELTDSQLRRIIEVLGQIPKIPYNYAELDFLAFDSEIKKMLLTTNSPTATSEIDYGDLALEFPEFVAWSWGALDDYRKDLRLIWTTPLRNTRSLEKRLEIAISNQPFRGLLASRTRGGYANLRLLSEECKARTSLLRIQAAASLFHRAYQRWPTSPAELKPYFGAENVPTDPLTENADFSFSISPKGWQASAHQIDRVLESSLPEPENAKSKD